MKIKDMIRQKLRNFLWIEKAQAHDIRVQELYDFESNAFRNRMWVRGDPYELSQFFKNTGSGNSMFWSSVPLTKIRKIHSGLPGMMVDVMTSIVCRDFNGIDLNGRGTDWEKISKDNDFEHLLHEAVDETITVGDGAFKISNDPSLSDFPIIEFFPGDRIDYKYKRGRLQEVIFRTTYHKNHKRYILYEHYGWGYIRYVLREAISGDPVGLDTLEETAQLQDIGFFGYQEDEKGKPTKKIPVILAVPLIFRNSSKWKGRGESLIDKKDTLFDALDEIISQWSAAVRSSRPIKYIPRVLAPRKADTGEIIPPNDFDNQYIATGSNNNEGERNEIKVVQPEIPSSSYLESYITYLDLCLQGFMSPSTLGIDTKKLDNADAQREKEKTTLYTRNMIIEALEKALPKLVNVTLQAYDAFTGKSMPDEVIATVKFGEYASPSFEALIETLSKAKTSNLMSIESLVDELYGDSKDEDWKAEEVERLKNELGIAGKEPEDEGLENIGEGGTANALLN